MVTIFNLTILSGEIWETEGESIYHYINTGLLHNGNVLLNIYFPHCFIKQNLRNQSSLETNKQFRELNIYKTLEELFRTIIQMRVLSMWGFSHCPSPLSAQAHICLW